LLPQGSVSPEFRAFLQHWLPSELASYRDAVVFIVLILVLLVRPQGILGKRDQEDAL
jgi:branched-subunit amino acid ABC-type transport system permease component